MKLAGTDGLSLLRSIKEQHPGQVVIIVTGYRHEMLDSIETALEIGAFTCLYKPLEIETLLQSLSEIRRQELIRILTQ
ncbi:MAG: response regulator [Anaerolineales bacterium]|nr:response regulator [Anaerolineales bacterium]